MRLSSSETSSTIILNGRAVVVPGDEMTYMDLALLAGTLAPTISVTHEGQSRSIVKGQSIKLLPGMEFDVDDTNNA